jgi:hypothetical protein
MVIFLFGFRSRSATRPSLHVRVVLPSLAVALDNVAVLLESLGGVGAQFRFFSVPRSVDEVSRANLTRLKAGRHNDLESGMVN